MTCGLCHRDADQHTLSTSGPTRCKYTTHRKDCPGNFSTNCSDHVVNGDVAPPDPGSEKLSETEEKVIEGLKNLLINDGLKTPVTENQIPKTPAGPGPFTPADANPANTNQNPLDEIGRMIREHVAKNQHHLSQTAPAPGVYNGPKMSEIRQDPSVQSQADIIMNTLKTALPVFGQNTSGGGAPPTLLPGINPLYQNLQPNNQPQQRLLQPQFSQPQYGPQQQPPDLTQLMQSLFPQQPQPSQQYCQQQAAVGQPQPLLQALQQLLGQQATVQQQVPVQQPTPVQPQQPQISADLLSALGQMGPNATPLLQALLQQNPLTTFNQQVQQPSPWTPASTQTPLGHLGQTNYQNYGQQFPGNLQQNVQLSNLLGQAYLPTAGPVQPQGLLQLQQPPQKQQLSAQGNSSMTGVMFARPTDFSKFCSVDYAKKAKPDNCNLVLYVWGFVAQILASKQGQISSMTEQEQIGRLQHLLHILELCAMQSSALDFNSAAWLCARNYSERVYQDLDSGATSWSQIGHKMHPTNMMMSMSAHPKVIPFKEKTKAVGATAQADGTPGAVVCPRWSTCDVEDKCQWEVDNPGKSCNWSHHCTFCFKKFKQSRKHKEADCRKKIESGGSNQDQPT